jgi:hypothetical protein
VNVDWINHLKKKTIITGTGTGIRKFLALKLNKMVFNYLLVKYNCTQNELVSAFNVVDQLLLSVFVFVAV